MMKKSANLILALLAAAGFAAASSAHAMGPGCHPMDGGMMFQGSPTSGKAAEFREKRLAALHDKLKLSAEQEAAWKTYGEKMQAALPQNRPDREEIRKLSTPERLDKMLALMKEGEKHMEARAAAVKEFYAVLTPEQRKLFDEQMAKHGRRFR